MEQNGPGTLGWQGSPKHIYSSRIIWVNGTLPIGSLGYRDFHGNVRFDTGRTDTYFSDIENIGVNWWANSLAHEVIWGSAGKNVDTTSDELQGDISNKRPFPFRDFTVTPENREKVMSDFGLR